MGSIRGFSEIPQPIRGSPDIQISGYPETWISGNPVFRISGNPDIRKSGYPDIRVYASSDASSNGTILWDFVKSHKIVFFVGFRFC